MPLRPFKVAVLFTVLTSFTSQSFAVGFGSQWEPVGAGTAGVAAEIAGFTALIARRRAEINSILAEIDGKVNGAERTRVTSLAEAEGWKTAQPQMKMQYLGQEMRKLGQGSTYSENTNDSVGAAKKAAFLAKPESRLSVPEAQELSEQLGKNDAFKGQTLKLTVVRADGSSNGSVKLVSETLSGSAQEVGEKIVDMAKAQKPDTARGSIVQLKLDYRGEDRAPNPANVKLALAKAAEAEQNKTKYEGERAKARESRAIVDLEKKIARLKMFRAGSAALTTLVTLFFAVGNMAYAQELLNLAEACDDRSMAEFYRFNLSWKLGHEVDELALAELCSAGSQPR